MKNRKIFIASVLIIMASTMYVFSDTRVKFRSRDNGTVYTKMVDSGETLSGSTVYYPYLGEVQTITKEHYERHEGEFYSVLVYDSDLDNGDSISISFLTGKSVKCQHVFAEVYSTGATQYWVIEGGTVTNDSGVTTATLNLNRNSTNVSRIKSINASPVTGSASVNATIAGEGTGKKIFTEVLGAGKEKQGAQSRTDGELILAFDTVYSIKQIGLADNNNAQITIRYYEDTCTFD